MGKPVIYSFMELYCNRENVKILGMRKVHKLSKLDESTPVSKKMSFLFMLRKMNQSIHFEYKLPVGPCMSIPPLTLCIYISYFNSGRLVKVHCSMNN